MEYSRIGTDVFADLADRIRAYGIVVRVKRLDVETPGRFDGPTITVDSALDRLEQCFHLAHAFGSIVAWSVDLPGATTVFAELRAAKRDRGRTGKRLDEALVALSHFEEVASEYAVWFLADVGHHELIEPYTTFFRADLDAMLIVHREGQAPVWPEFFAAWKQRVTKGTISVKAYVPRAIPDLVAVRIPWQEVVQEHDGQP